MRTILNEIRDIKNQQDSLFHDLSTTKKKLNKDLQNPCPYQFLQKKEINLTNLGIKLEDIENAKGKTITPNRVKLILWQLYPDSKPEQLLRQLREKNIIKPFKSKFSSKLSGKYYLGSIIDYIKSQHNSPIANRQQRG